MSVAKTAFLGPNLSHLPSFPTNRFKPQFFNANLVSFRSTLSSQFLRRRNFLPSQRRRRSRLFGLLGTIDGEGEEDGRGKLERNGILEQEEKNPFIGGCSRFLSPAVRTGLEPTLNRLSKWFVAALFTAAVLWRHDVEALWVSMGCVLNAALSVVWKRILNQERPRAAKSSDPGMPSSHAQCIFYSVIFVIWSLTEWIGTNVLSFILGTHVLAFGSYLSWLRVSQQYHTISRVVAGATVGSGFAFLWLWSWKAFIVDAFISSLWIRLAALLGAAICCLGFVVYVFRHWLRDEQ